MNTDEACGGTIDAAAQVPSGFICVHQWLHSSLTC
jgi:hypothetical protein